jgi:nucleoside-diphosphate-sugar epimerase
VGRQAVRLGIDAGAAICAVDRAPIAQEGCEVRVMDLQDGSGLRSFLLNWNPDAVIHLAASGVSFGKHRLGDLLADNVLPLNTILEALHDCGRKAHLVVAGSGFEYHPEDRPLSESDPLGPRSLYGVSKVAATMLAGTFASRLPITVVRPFFVYGLGEREPRLVPYIIASALKKTPVELTPGGQVRDYLFVTDLAEGFWRVMANPPPLGAIRSVNLGGVSPMPLKNFVIILAELLQEQGMPADIRFGCKPYRPEEIMCYLADNSLLQRLCEWSPPTTVENGLRQTIHAMMP